MYSVWCDSCSGALWSTHTTEESAKADEKTHIEKHWQYDGYIPETYIDYA